ncbi:MAG: hypothetical protein K8J31_30480 [Anaerolineae bacterium]|nr:hypothetical protein [Anaerolineae bacterium]
MDTVQDFLRHELDMVDRSIQQMEDAIHADPSANGRHAGMKAMLRVQQQHHDILERLAAEAQDLPQALEICQLLLMVSSRAHARATEEGGVCNARSADAWWNTLNQMEYLAGLGRQMQAVMKHAHAQHGHVNGKGPSPHG